MGFRVLQVSNISTVATRDQIHTLFKYIGKVEEIKVYPSEQNITTSTTQKFAFIRFEDEKSVELGQHLTNTVLIDRALICIPSMDGLIPTEEQCMNMGGPALPGQRQLPPHLINKINDVGDGSSLLFTMDPTLEQLGLPHYPPLPGNTEPGKVEEIRRTIYVGNIPKGTDGQAIVDFFNTYVGEVMYVRLAGGSDTLPCLYAYVEFTQQSSVPVALQNAGISFNGSPLRIQHSRVAIIKPQQKTAAQALEEIENAIKMNESGATRRRSRSRSPRRRRSPSPRRRSPSPRRRSPSPRRRSPSPRRISPRRRSRTRSRTRSPRRRRDRSKERRRSRSRKRSRSRDRKDRKDRRRSRSRSTRRDRKKSRSRTPKRKRSGEREKRDRSRDRKKKDYEEEEKEMRERLLNKVNQRKDNDDSE